MASLCRYVLDSIIKNIQSGQYVKHFCAHLPLLASYYLEPWDTYAKMFESWRPIFPTTVLSNVRPKGAKKADKEGGTMSAGKSKSTEKPQKSVKEEMLPSKVCCS